MALERIIRALESPPFYRGQLSHIRIIPRREASFASPEELPSFRFGPRRLYRHQAQAIRAVLEGANVVISTGPASGKSLCYNLPVVEALLEDRSACALYLFPTKALAQDQLRNLKELGREIERIGVGIYDGDTPPPERRRIRRSARLIFSNPDMLHFGILPNHRSWARFLGNLKFVVVDEVHVYRGVFGSHVANVLRRLRRLCRLYGSSPQFICCSATIANPAEHAERLVGLPFLPVTEDTAPRGKRYFVFWNPRESGRSPYYEAAVIFAKLIREHLRSLLFVRSRRLAELIYRYARKELSEEGDGALASRIASYRGGYLPEERREIERGLFGGELLGVVATNALELGIDIGDLDASILAGYPGSISSTWQQVGRSGRRNEEALSVLIATDDPLDQYLVRHPEEFFEKPFEHALSDPSNPYILKPHLLCAAWEYPLGSEDEEFFGKEMRELCSELESQGLLQFRKGRFFPSPQIPPPAQHISIRSASGRPFRLVERDSGALLEILDAETALRELYPGAIYLHRDETYLIEELDLANGTAYASRAQVDYYTQPRIITDINVLEVKREKQVGSSLVAFGKVEVTERIIGFRKRQIFTEKIIGEEFLDLPPQIFHTCAFWFTVPARIAFEVKERGLHLEGGLHALEHASIALLPLFALCDRNDIGGVSMPYNPEIGNPVVFIYDAHPGGVGIAEKGYEIVVDLWRKTLKLISECGCEEGCPSCIQSPKCGNNNEPLDKEASKLILRLLLDSIEISGEVRGDGAG